MPHILVIANETIAGAALLKTVRERAAQPDTTFSLVVPMTKPRSGLVIYDEAVRDAAQVRVDLALSYLRGEGITATGEVGDEDPFTAAMDAVHEYRPDEIVVSTLPAASSGWLRRDLVERIQDAAADIPVTHVISDVDAEGLPFTVTLVVANQTVTTETLLRRMKEKAAETEDQLFIVVVPQTQGDGRAAAQARARLGNMLDKMRREGLLIAGMIGDPDPFDATMNALQFYKVDSVIISTLPVQRSRWLRADLVSRVRKASNIEVEHIVAEHEPAEAS
ncbi:MAG: hypothetical protein M3296_08785 [Actinomycetota bacterium]|nr:hypothetical protein [Actinomycetota bacterium]